MPQPHLRQQAGFNDVSLLQQQNMLKQLQELQRQHQVQQFGDARHQNPVNQLPMIMKQATSGQFPPMINRTPIHGTSQVFMNWMPHGSSSPVQGVPNQQLDVSLYGTPVTRGHLSQSSYLQGVQKSTMQLSNFSSPMLGDQRTISQEQACMSDEAFTSKQGFQKRDPFGQAPLQGLYDGVLPENFEQGNIRQKNAPIQEHHGAQGRDGLPLAALDPMEQKILFSMDENIWDATFGKPTAIDSGSFGKTSEHPDERIVFPFSQSGSYSALMQSAVAEASSSDTDLQEWSGLTFQNTDLSTENQPSNFVDSRKQPIGWEDNNLQSSSIFNDSNVQSSFPGIKQPDSPFSMEQKEGLHQDSSHESIHQSPDGKWFNLNQQHKSPIEENQRIQPLEKLDNAWSGQIYQRPKNDLHQKSIYLLNSTMPGSNSKGRSIDLSSRVGNTTLMDNGDREKNFENCWMGDISGSGYKRRDLDGCPWNTDGSNLVNREGSLASTFSDLPNSNATKSIRETSELTSDSHRFDCMKKDLNVYVKHTENENMEISQHRLDNRHQSLNCSNKGADEVFEYGQNCYPKENSPSDSYNSNLSHHSVIRHDMRENTWLNASDYQARTGISQKPPNQVLCSRGLRTADQEYFGQFKSTVGGVSNSVVGLEKGQLPDFQGNPRPSTEVASRGNLESGISPAGDRLAGFYGSDISAQTSQDMLELLHRQSREGMTVQELQVPEEQKADASLSQPFNQSYASQQSGLRLDPTLQQLPSLSHLSYSQGLPQTENSLMSVASGSTPNLRSLLHGQLVSNAPVPYQLSQSTWSGRLQPFNLACSRDSSQPIFAQPSSQQFPVLQQSELVRPPNAWTKTPTQQSLSVDELQKGPFADLSKNSLETPSLVQRELNVQNLPRDRSESSIGAGSVNSKGYDYEEENPAKGRSHHVTSSEKLNHPAALTINSIQPIESAASSLETHLPQSDFEKSYSSNRDPALLRRDVDAFGRPLRPSHGVHQNYTSLHQLPAMNNLNPEASKTVKNQNMHQAAFITGQESFYQHMTGVGNPMDGKMHAAPRFASYARNNIGFESLMSGVRADQTVQPSLQRLPSLEMDKFGLNYSRSHSTKSQIEFNQTENAPGSVQDAPNWFKQYENFRNEKMVPTYNANLERPSHGQVFEEKASHNFPVHGSVEQIYASTNQVDDASAITNGGLLGSEHLRTPSIPTSGITVHTLSVVRPKKRKTATSMLVPWHKEVTDGSQAFQNISMAKQEWAQATNCLVEKMDDVASMIGDNSPTVRSKRRLTITTRLMQQLLRPAPLDILQADSMTKHDCVLYSVAKLALGDACSLSTCMRNDSGNMMDSDSDRDFSKAVEDCTTRANTLESDLLRLEKKVSILDIRLEWQEMEKHSVLNRFAKFHARMQADAAGSTPSPGTAATAPRPFLQRYVLAVPMPEVLPEQMKCLSL